MDKTLSPLPRNNGKGRDGRVREPGPSEATLRFIRQFARVCRVMKRGSAGPLGQGMTLN